MTGEADVDVEGWGEDDSRAFLEYGALFVPRREEQMRALVELLPSGDGALHVVELCCGQGLLAERILEARPDASVTGIDGSPEMLRAARSTNLRFGDRFQAVLGDLAEVAIEGPVDAVVSSLAIHHLEHDGKRRLFAAIARALRPGGALIVLDIVEPGGDAARALAAREWDRAVQEAARAACRADAVEAFRAEGWNHFALPEPDPIDRPATVADQLTWMREAGLAEVDVFWLFAGHALIGGFKR